MQVRQSRKTFKLKIYVNQYYGNLIWVSIWTGLVYSYNFWNFDVLCQKSSGKSGIHNHSETDNNNAKNVY